ncbi:protein of unknown function [Nocardioides sp. YR527]|uniref:DUF4913 domain-containing protein n=1 Tax=Nocardioides sp. YR527 TaxID=1881028 RepID=UPI000890B1F1|nr:DUF4913 domain-containing protein [Nocardioides sp. YR527]SDL33536.1 protein of unknown function [Nocardioides sp. YR527]
MERNDDYFDDETEELTPAAAAPKGSPFEPDPDLIATAQEALRLAEAAAETAETAHETAEDDLADAEGAVAVAEFKVTDFEADSGLREWEKAAAREELSRAKRAYSRAVQRLGRAKVRLEDTAAALEQASAALDQAEKTPAPSPEPEEQPQQRFASLPVFVEEYVVPNWIHKLGENYAGSWCTKWWEHTEAITRLEATWEAFEVMRLQPPPSLSTWIRDHLDVHMRALTAPHGVFHNCNAREGDHVHDPRRPWAVANPPEGLFEVNKDALVHGRSDAAAAEPGERDDAEYDISAYEMNGMVNEETGEVNV